MSKSTETHQLVSEDNAFVLNASQAKLLVNDFELVGTDVVTSASIKDVLSAMEQGSFDETAVKIVICDLCGHMYLLQGRNIAEAVLEYAKQDPVVAYTVTLMTYVAPSMGEIQNLLDTLSCNNSDSVGVKSVQNPSTTTKSPKVGKNTRDAYPWLDGDPVQLLRSVLEGAHAHETTVEDGGKTISKFSLSNFATERGLSQTERVMISSVVQQLGMMRAIGTGPGNRKWLLQTLSAFDTFVGDDAVHAVVEKYFANASMRAELQTTKVQLERVSEQLRELKTKTASEIQSAESNSVVVGKNPPLNDDVLKDIASLAAKNNALKAENKLLKAENEKLQARPEADPNAVAKALLAEALGKE